MAFDISLESFPYEKLKDFRIDRKMNTFYTNFLLLAKLNLSKVFEN